MSEALKYKGRLVEQELKARDLKIELESFRDQLRDKLDPFEPVETLDGESILAMAFRFSERQIEYQAILVEISKIKSILGR